MRELNQNSNTSGHYLSYGIKTWHDGWLMHAISSHARLDDRGIDARSQWVGKGKH